MTKDQQFVSASLWLLFYLSLLKERIFIMNLGHRDFCHVNLFHVVPDVVFLV